MQAITISKFENCAYSEDCSLADVSRLAISDGAGGVGIFAERWSAYLLKVLPQKAPTNYEAFSKWIEAVWEPFFDENKSLAASIGGFAQNKYYDEGSYATLAAAWINDNCVQWLTYGDSVVFHYNRASCQLEHSFTRLADFSASPWLINWKEETKPEGIRLGEFQVTTQSIVFIASDALAFYLLGAFNSYHPTTDRQLQMQEVLTTPSLHNKLLLNITQSVIAGGSFEQSVLTPLVRAAKDENSFGSYLKGLFGKGLITSDDYSLAWHDFQSQLPATDTPNKIRLHLAAPKYPNKSEILKIMKKLSSK